MLHIDLFDQYVHYRMHIRPYNTDTWDVLWAAFCFSTDIEDWLK